MIKSIKSRILIVVVTLTTATLVAVTFMTWKNFKLEVEDLHRKLLINLLRSVTNVIESKYDELVKYEFDSIGKRRMLMESMTISVVSALKNYHALYESGVLSKDDARSKSLKWLEGLTYGEKQYFFVFDMDIMGLSHPIDGMVGRKWEGFKDQKQQDAMFFMRDVVKSKKSGYTVLEWPILPKGNLIKQMAFFTYFPEWDWIIGTSVRIDDIEKDSKEKIHSIKRDLESIVPNIRIDEEEQIYLFDSNGNMIVHPKVLDKCFDYNNDGNSCNRFIKCLMDAAKRFDTPFDHSSLCHDINNLGGLTYIDYYQPMDLYVAVSISGDEISRPVDHLITRQIYMILAILLIGMLVAILFSNRLTSHLLLLAQYARDLPKKDLIADDKQNISGLMSRWSDDEVGYLLKAFTFMETQLRQSFRQLTWQSSVSSAFAEISSALIESIHVDEISDLVLHQARQLTGSEYGFVGYIDPDVGSLICPTFTGDIWDACQVSNKKAVFEELTGLWGWVLVNRKPLLSNSPSDDPRSKGVPPGHVKIDRFLSVPAMIGDLLVGQISLANPGRDYTQEDQALVERLASFYALAVQRKHTEDALADSREQLRHLSSQLLVTQEEERRMIAQDLHDSIGQSLAAIKFSVENALHEVTARHTVAVVQSLQRIIPVVQNAMEEARKIYTGLRPSSLDDLGIIATISWFCREYQETYKGLWIESDINIEEEDIPEPLKIVVFRILQEALNNIARHSKAEWVDISFVKRNGLIQLTIKDDGIGFHLDSPSNEVIHGASLGITGMKERTRLAGGVFRIESVVGEGTTIHASWPCHHFIL